MGALIPFPTTPAPAKPETLSYWHCCGALFRNAGGRGVYMPTAEAIRERGIYERAAAERYTERRIPEAREAARMWGQLNAALDALDLYSRQTGRPSPIVAAMLQASTQEPLSLTPKEA